MAFNLIPSSPQNKIFDEIIRIATEAKKGVPPVLPRSEMRDNVVGGLTSGINDPRSLRERVRTARENVDRKGLRELLRESEALRDDIAKVNQEVTANKGKLSQANEGLEVARKRMSDGVVNVTARLRQENAALQSELERSEATGEGLQQTIQRLHREMLDGEGALTRLETKIKELRERGDKEGETEIETLTQELSAERERQVELETRATKLERELLETKQKLENVESIVAEQNNPEKIAETIKSEIKKKRQEIKKDIESRTEHSPDLQTYFIGRYIDPIKTRIFAFANDADVNKKEEIVSLFLGAEEGGKRTGGEIAVLYTDIKNGLRELKEKITAKREEEREKKDREWGDEKQKENRLEEAKEVPFDKTQLENRETALSLAKESILATVEDPLKALDIIYQMYDGYQNDTVENLQSAIEKLQELKTASEKDTVIVGKVREYLQEKLETIQTRGAEERRMIAVREMQQKLEAINRLPSRDQNIIPTISTGTQPSEDIKETTPPESMTDVLETGKEEQEREEGEHEIIEKEETKAEENHPTIQIYKRPSQSAMEFLKIKEGGINHILKKYFTQGGVFVALNKVGIYEKHLAHLTYKEFKAMKQLPEGIKLDMLSRFAEYLEKVIAAVGTPDEGITLNDIVTNGAILEIL